MSAPRITIDHSRCVGNAQCVTLAPRVFRHNDAVQSEVVDPGAASLDLILKAARYCPTSAIKVESSSGDPLFP